MNALRALALAAMLVITFLLAAPITAPLSAAHPAPKVTPAGATWNMIWSPIHMPMFGEKWKARTDGFPVFPAEYAKQYYQTQFRLVGLFNGDGGVLLSYGDLGDEVEFHYDQPTAMTVDTIVPWGGGTVPIPLSVYLSQRGPRTATITHPDIFVGQIP